ncbi:MAG TPA: DUF5666 domain-containing protein [Ktedonobacteraceae bacterium]|nr:DUF5666 domain-containing protein [Ktedonobacteraceae bacterium]
MEDYEDATSGKLVPPPVEHRRWRGLLLVSGLALAFMLALGIGVLLGSTTSTTQAASFAPADTTNAQTQDFQSAQANGPQLQAFGPGAQGQGQCEAMTVSSVNGNTIVAKTASGSSVTIHTTASTKYTKAGATVSASAIKAGTRIQVMGTHNSDGSITATSIVIG